MSFGYVTHAALEGLQQERNRMVSRHRPSRPDESLAADAADERRVRDEAAQLQDVATPEAIGDEDIGVAAPDEVGFTDSSGQSIDVETHPFDEGRVRPEDVDQGIVERDVEGQPARIRRRLENIERETDAELEQQRDE